MALAGSIDSLWRYPVKSMRGEQLRSVWVGAGGLAGDRRFAVRSTAAPASLPYLTGRAQERMLLYRAFYEDPAAVEENAKTGGALPALLVDTPAGDRFSIHDPRLLEILRVGHRQPTILSIETSPAAIADECPVSLLSLQTVEQLAAELGVPVDGRRFRANFYANWLLPQGFQEDAFVGRRLGIGDEVVLELLKRDPRCKMITLCPDTAVSTPELLRHVAAAHERCTGVYGTVLHEGTVREGDPIHLMD